MYAHLLLNMCKHWKGSSPSFTALLTHTFPSFSHMKRWRMPLFFLKPSPTSVALYHFTGSPDFSVSLWGHIAHLLTSLPLELAEIFPWYQPWLPAVIFSYLIGKREKVRRRKDRCRWKRELESDKHLCLFVESLIKVEWLSNWFVTVTLTWPSIMATQAWVELLRWGGPLSGFSAIMIWRDTVMLDKYLCSVGLLGTS